MSNLLLPPNKRVSRVNDSYLRLLLYADLGFGKSYWANQFPDPFFINTDGNLVHIDAPGNLVRFWKTTDKEIAIAKTPEQIAAVTEKARASFTNIVDELVKTNGGGFKTVVVDLIGGIYTLAREFKLDELGVADEGDTNYNSGYSQIRALVLGEIRKLWSLPVNVILLAHEETKVIKDNLNRETTFITPDVTGGNPGNDKMLKLLAQTGLTLRGYLKTLVLDDGETDVVRMLSLSSKTTETHVARLTDAEGTFVKPNDIELTYQGFIDTLASLKDPANVGKYEKASEKELELITAGGKTKAAKNKPAVTIKAPPSKPATVKETTPKVETPVDENEVVEETVEEVIVETTPTPPVEPKPKPVPPRPIPPISRPAAPTPPPVVTPPTPTPKPVVTPKPVPPPVSKPVVAPKPQASAVKPPVPPKPGLGGIKPPIGVIKPSLFDDEEDDGIVAPTTSSAATESQQERIARIQKEVFAKRNGNK